MLTLPVYRALPRAAGAPVSERPFVVRETTPVTPPKPRLLDRVRTALRARHYSRRTEQAYVAWIIQELLGASGREPDDDLHARPESRAGRGTEPSGPDVHPVTWPAALEPNHSGIGCRTMQPIRAGEGPPNRTQGAESTGPEVEKTRGWSQVGIGCKNSPESRY